MVLTLFIKRAFFYNRNNIIIKYNRRNSSSNSNNDNNDYEINHLYLYHIYYIIDNYMNNIYAYTGTRNRFI